MERARAARRETPAGHRRRSQSHEAPATERIQELQASAGNRAVTQLLTQGRGVIQRFGSGEHQELGNVGSGGLAYHMGPDGPRSANMVEAHPFRLSHGDITMLSGDYFDPRDTITENGQDVPNPEALFKIAGTPSSDPGKQLGTQDEIIAAVKHATPSDPRFVKATGGDPSSGGEWSDIQLSDEVTTTVKNRYLRLA